jgi:hypothetical protein
MLAVDAFSSDAIPLHLITREAVSVYVRALASDGVVLLHISNRFVDLEPVVSSIARDLGLAAAVRNDFPDDTANLTASSWVALARKRSTLETLAQNNPDAAWQALAPPAERSWSDQRASILPAIRWNQLLGKP